MASHRIHSTSALVAILLASVAAASAPSSARAATCTSVTDPEYADLLERVIDFATSRQPSVSVGFYDEITRTECYWGETKQYYTASMIKATVLAALLHWRNGQLSEWERERAERMIVNPGSGDAANIAGNAAQGDLIDHMTRDRIVAFVELVGMSDTVLGADRQSFGTSLSTARDQIKLLRAITGKGSNVLSPPSRAIALELLGRTGEYGHDWGVSNGKPRGTTSHVKIGYFQFSFFNVRTHSVGAIRGVGTNGRAYDHVMALLSDQNPPGLGVSLLNSIAAQIHRFVRGRACAVVNTCDGQRTCGQCPPDGSYRQTCLECSVDDSSVLHCSCLDRDGRWLATDLALGCAADIANCNGSLTCGSCDQSPGPGLPNPVTECAVIYRDQGLHVNQSQWSCNGNYQLTVQGDGNVVLYRKSGIALWATQTFGSPVRRLLLQSDGNLVAYDAGSTAYWASNTHGFEGAYARVQDDGNFVIHEANGLPIWASNTVQPPVNPPTECGVAYPGQGIVAGETLASCDGRFALRIESDGNLKLQQGSMQLWTTDTGGQRGHYAVMQADGNFVLYDAQNGALWTSDTFGFEGAYARVQNDGNFVVYEAAGLPIWATDTCCH